MGPYSCAMADPNGRDNDGLRKFNRGRVLGAVRAGRATNRAELRTATGLARSTITGLVGELLAERVLVEVPDAHDSDRRAGRPARRLRVAPRDDLVVAVDLGHSHCRVGVLDSSAQVIHDESAPMDTDSSADQALDHASAVIDRLLTAIGPERSRVVGGAIGLPAPVNPSTGTVGPGNVLPQWVDRHPAAELQRHLGFPVAIENDANLGALAEIAYGAARGLHDVIYVKASTGIGAGLVLGGQLYRGSTGRAGEIGHVPVDPTGPLCRCGNRGCLETVASVTQVLAMMQPPHDQPLTMARVAQLVDADDAGANRVLGDAGRTMGRVLADMVNNLNPEMLVVGGELSLAGAPLLAGVRESIERFAQPGIVRDLRICLGELGERAQLLGAAALALSLP
ncbi:MAG: Sugar kinase of the family, may containing an N-terminal domain [Pseudonocardiales bacterium]|nr:Sugar kinase of the family, may containing an N-terminal domain [Pseudonocardiales bacterium]